MKPIRELKDELDRCVRCGTCRSTCPTFRVLGRETASMRGRLSLIRALIDGEIELNETYIKHIKECTLCGACRESCPNGVNTTGLIAAARADAVEKLGLPFAASFVFKNLLDSGRLMPWALKLANAFKGIIFKGSPENGLVSRFSLPLIGNNRLVPPLASVFFLDMPEVKALARPDAPDTAQRPVKVAFYAGCGVNFLLPEVGMATLEVLKKAGAQVTVPPGQVCCGMPAFSTGDVKTAREMALKNLDAFESIGCDYIATSCATCGYGLKKLFKNLLGEDPETKSRIEAFAAKVRDITELLVNELGYEGGGGNNGGMVVTYHDPCHLGRNQGVRDAPRQLLKKNTGLSFKEMKFPCSCCGLGGGLAFTNYELSIDITRRKIESIRDCGAEIVATACPGCMVQLRDGLHRYGVKAKVSHVVELL